MSRPSIQAFKAITVTPEYLNKKTFTDHQLQALKYHATTFTSHYTDIYSIEFVEETDDSALLTVMFTPNMTDEAIYAIYDSLMKSFSSIEDLFVGEHAIHFGEPSKPKETEFAEPTLVPIQDLKRFRVRVLNQDTTEYYEFLVSAKDEASIDKLVCWLFDEFLYDEEKGLPMYSHTAEEASPVNDLKAFIDESVLHKGFYIRKIMDQEEFHEH